MKTVLLYVFFVSAFFMNSFAQDAPLDAQKAEDVYSQALIYDSDGKHAEALQGLRYMVYKGYTNEYIFYSMLDISAAWANEVINQEGEDSTNVQMILSNAQIDAAYGASIYPADKTILYHYCDFSRGIGNYKDFLIGLNQILKSDPDDIFGNYYTGAYYFINKNYEKAKNYFLTAISSPSNRKEQDLQAVYRSLYDLGMIEISGQNYLQAVDYLEKARSIYSGDMELTRIIAFSYSEQILFSKALENFRMIPENYYNEEIETAVGMLLYIRKDPAADKFIQKYQKDSGLLQAIIDYQNKKYGDALKKIDSYMNSQQISDFFSHYLLFRIFESQKDLEKMRQQAVIIGNLAKTVGNFEVAIEYFKKLENYTKSQPYIYWLIGSLYDDHDDYTNATAYYDKYIRSPGNDEYRISAMVRQAYLYSKSGSNKKAQDMINQARKKSANDEDLFQVNYYSGLMQVENRNFTNAIADFQNAVKIHTNEVRLYFFMGTAYYELKDRKNAIDVLETGRTINPAIPEMNNLLAYLYSLENTKLDDAVKLANLALVAQPDNPAYLDTLGWIYFQQTNYQKAFETFGQVAAILTKNTNQDGNDEIYYHMGMVYDKMGNPDEAQKYYKKGLEINPKNTEIPLKIKKD